MTPLGTLIFSVIGVLFVAAVGAAIWWAMRGANAMTDALRRDGWAIEKPQRGNTKWIARRTRAGVAACVEVTASGIEIKTVWTRVRMTTDTGADDVLVERKSLGFLAADGALATAAGFKPPPGWNGGSPAFMADYNAYASSDGAATRWLSPANQSAIIDYNNTAPRKVAVRYFENAIEARWGQEPQNAEQVESLVALLDALRRRR